jgi:hypothetical protein
MAIGGMTFADWHFSRLWAITWVTFSHIREEQADPTLTRGETLEGQCERIRYDSLRCSRKSQFLSSKNIPQVDQFDRGALMARETCMGACGLFLPPSIVFPWNCTNEKLL